MVIQYLPHRPTNYTPAKKCPHNFKIPDCSKAGNLILKYLACKKKIHPSRFMVYYLKSYCVIKCSVDILKYGA